MENIIENKDLMDLHVIPGCPWHEMLEKWGPPNLNWCEAPVCSYFNNPANTWSNLGFILLGIYVLFRARKYLCIERLWYGLTLFTVGALSFVYHATNNGLTQYFDFFGMFLFLSYLFYIYHIRLGREYNGRRSLAMGFIVFLMFNLLYYVFPIINIPIQYIIALAIFLLIGLEVKTNHFSQREHVYWTHSGKFHDKKYFFLTLLCFGIGEALSLMDLKRIFCDPNNHIIQGHALWHLFDALGLYFLYFYLGQFSFFKKSDK
ncbi:MAG: ceramidase domain-containing protein [Halobacteriovoraceae bacterium]|nr:ceramidase domain-containing protein [Halobacteriovoraceae bacterium]